MNPYEILGVDRNAKDKTIKKAYMEMTRKWHPDLYHNKEDIRIANAKMQEINAAWELIGSPESRAAFDKEHPVSVYEYYAKKQTSSKNTKHNTSTDIEMEKQRKAVLEFLNVEYKHKNDIFDMFAELATLALKNEISNVDYSDSLELIFEEVKECIRNIEKIISVAKSKNLTGMDITFAKAGEAIKELEQKADETPKTLSLAHYEEETRILSEKISNLMSELPKRINAVIQFNLLRKTWEFKDDNQLNSAKRHHKKQVEKLLKDINWIQKTALERNIAIEGVDLNPDSESLDPKLSLDKCRKKVKSCEEVLDLNLQGLREKFWKELCAYTKNEKGETIFIGILDGWFYPIRGDFICPPNIDRLSPSLFSSSDFHKVNSISIPASLILKEKDISISIPRKRLIFTFSEHSQVVDASIFPYDDVKLSSECDCICISTGWWSNPEFALVDSNNIFFYDKKNLCSLYGVNDLEEISDSYYPNVPKERFFVHTWAQVAKKLPDPSIMELLPCTVESIRNWLGLRKTNFDTSFSKVDKYSRKKLVRLYIALGALNDTYCHAQAEWLISKLDVSTMYRSRLERFPEENKTNTNSVFSVPKLAVDFVEANISNEDFLPYVYIFLEGYKFFQSEAKKAKVSLTPNFVISTAPQYVFHSKADGISDFAIELLKAEKIIESNLADEILHLRREHNNNLKKNIIETTDMGDRSAMHYKYLDLKSLQSYLAFKDYFRLKKSYHRIESENVFLSSNSHAIEIINGENKCVTLVILNLLDEGELFADIVDYDYYVTRITVLETIRRALMDQKNSNNLVTGISIGSNEDPNTSNQNRWRDIVAYNSDIEWLQNVKWIKFEYLFESRVLGTSYKGYRARFMLEGHEQKLNPPNPYNNPRNNRRFNRW